METAWEQQGLHCAKAPAWPDQLGCCGTEGRGPLVAGHAETAAQPRRSSAASPAPESAAEHNLTLRGSDVKQIFVLVTLGLRRASAAPLKSISRLGPAV